MTDEELTSLINYIAGGSPNAHGRGNPETESYLFLVTRMQRDTIVEALRHLIASPRSAQTSGMETSQDKRDA